MIELINPSQILLTDFKYNTEVLKKQYTYTNKSVFHQIQRLKKNHWFITKYGEEVWKEELAKLREKLSPCLIKEINDGLLTYSGFLKDIQQIYPDEFKAHYTYPTPVGLPWYSPPPFSPKDYQLEALKAFFDPHNRHHGCIALPPGTGKSFCILLLLKELGLKSIVMVPSVAIGKQLFKFFSDHLGTRYVGLYGAGKKQLNKLITVSLGQSLANIKPNTKEWKYFSSCQVLVSDEAHSDAADTFSSVCLGLCKDIPYRFFSTATPMRNDGSDLLLKGIVGPNILSKTFEEAVDEGHIAKPTFLIKKITSLSTYYNQDALKMIERHWYSNKELHKDAALLANRLVSDLNHKVMIMMDHVRQFSLIYPYLLHTYDFAHGPLSKENIKSVPERFRNKKIDQVVYDFNHGNTSILCGTGAISVGVDTKPVDTVINLQSGASEVKFIQLVGRGNRVTKTKKEFRFVDYDVENIQLLHMHTLKRIKIYRDLYDNMRFLNG